VKNGVFAVPEVTHKNNLNMRIGWKNGSFISAPRVLGVVA